MFQQTKINYNKFRNTMKIFLLLLLICLFSLSNSLHLQNNRKKASSLGNQDSFLKDSQNYFVTQQGNIVWAGALSLAWHQLTENIIKDDVKLNSDDNIVTKIVNNFNTCPFKKDSLQDSDYYIKSGYGQKTVTKINNQVKLKFPNKTFSDIDANLSDKDIISYAYLAKSFQYPVQFKKLDAFKFKDKSVKGFTAGNDAQRSQVSYFYYDNDSEFLIKIKTKKQNEGVYYLRTKNNDARMQDIIKKVIISQNEKTSMEISEHDYFSMPSINFDYSRDFSQIQKINLLNANFQDYQFTTVYEALKLNIDQTGVKVQNQGVIIIKRTATMVQPPIQHKYFILNDSFWIILKENGKYPYLCIKVNQPVQKQEL